MRSTLALIAVLSLCPLAASAEDFAVDEEVASESVGTQDLEQEIDIFPLTNMDTKANRTLRTSVESGEMRAVLVIRADEETSLPTSSAVISVSPSPSN
ncbi:hypothetical protein EBR21_05395 [bacterium]|nr:hypothetical protein [bacterium]